jgi:peptidyl-prolyl cis-trans isomerase SurA
VMSQIPIRTLCNAFAVAMVALAGLLAVPAAGRAQEVVALVDGQPITALDIEQRAKFIQMSTQKAPSRKVVLDGLIDEILEIREARKFNINVPDAEVDNAFASIGTRMGVDAAKLTQMLAKGGASAETLKHRLKAELAWNALVKGRYKSSLEIADSDIEAQLDLHKPEDKNQVGYEYVLRPVLFVVARGSADTSFEARKKEADALRTRFLTCAEGIPFARALREVAVRDQVIKFSADLPPALRDILEKTDVGHLTPPEQTAEGVQMFALCSKKENKTETPGRREVRDEMFQQKFSAQAKRYLAQIRREAMIEYKTPVEQK